MVREELFPAQIKAQAAAIPYFQPLRQPAVAVAVVMAIRAAQAQMGWREALAVAAVEIKAAPHRVAQEILRL